MADDVIDAVDDLTGLENNGTSVIDDRITSQDVVFGSNTKSAQKLANQMANRGD